mmetsp:Transcript_21481/g.61562  ORF Transcript_21481/g.61562 Transcript_21481/m.61562 type:complete len:391 (-) Transcript_21481:167-1339(-)
MLAKCWLKDNDGITSHHGGWRWVFFAWFCAILFCSSFFSLIWRIIVRILAFIPGCIFSFCIILNNHRLHGHNFFHRRLDSFLLSLTVVFHFGPKLVIRLLQLRFALFYLLCPFGIILLGRPHGYVITQPLRQRLDTPIHTLGLPFFQLAQFGLELLLAIDKGGGLSEHCRRSCLVRSCIGAAIIGAIMVVFQCSCTRCIGFCIRHPSRIVGMRILAVLVRFRWQTLLFGWFAVVVRVKGTNSSCGVFVRSRIFGCWWTSLSYWLLISDSRARSVWWHSGNRSTEMAPLIAHTPHDEKEHDEAAQQIAEPSRRCGRGRSVDGAGSTIADSCGSRTTSVGMQLVIANLFLVSRRRQGTSGATSLGCRCLRLVLSSEHLFNYQFLAVLCPHSN